MPYRRKTRDEYEILADYGGKWEVVTVEETLRDALNMLKDYRENDHYARRHKYRKRRVPVNQEV